MLAEGASGYGKNILVVLRFVFQRVSHALEYARTLMSVKTTVDLAKPARAIFSSVSTPNAPAEPIELREA
jgi:hypothetical protein